MTANPNALSTNNANVAAVSTPATLDIANIVATFALKKADEHGRQVFSTGRGKQNLFSIVCQYVKSLRGMPRTDALPDDVAASIKSEIDTFLRGKLDAMLTEYSTFTVRTGGLGVRIDKKGQVTSKAFATFKGERDTRDEKEHKFACLLELGKLEKALNRAIDKNDTELETEILRKIEILRKERNGK